MRNMARWALLLVLLVSSQAVDQPSASAQSPANEGSRVVFTVGTTSDLLSPNPFTACCGLDYEVMLMNYDMLFNFSLATLEPTAGMAEFPPEVSEDGKTWTFKIREGVTWQDGTPLTAQDVAFTYNFIIDNELGRSFSNYLGVPAKLDPFSAPDATTFVWKMETPTLAPLAPPWIPILPEHVWEKLDGKPSEVIKAFKNLPTVGSGPFQLVEWQEGRFVRMEATHDYWAGDSVIDEVVFRHFGSPESLALALETGEVDFAEALPPELFQRLETQPDIATNESAALAMDTLSFNFEGTANPVLRNVKVRLAISHAIDRQALVDRVLKGYGSVGSSVVLPAFRRWAWEPSGSQVQGFDPELARELLDEAGYVDKDGDGVREGAAGSLEIELTAISSEPYSNSSAKLIAGWLNDVGFDARVQVVSEAKVSDLWYAQDFDAYVWGWAGDPDPDIFNLSIFTTEQCLWWSDGCYKDPAYDAMWERQHLETDQDARKQTIIEMQQYLYEHNPMIVLFYERDLQAYRKDRWTGFQTQPQPVGSLLFAWGNQSYLSLRPVGEAGPADGGRGSGGRAPMGTLALIGAAVLVVFVAFAVRKRRNRHLFE